MSQMKGTKPIEQIQIETIISDDSNRAHYATYALSFNSFFLHETTGFFDPIAFWKKFGKKTGSIKDIYVVADRENSGRIEEEKQRGIPWLTWLAKIHPETFKAVEKARRQMEEEQQDSEGDQEEDEADLYTRFDPRQKNSPQGGSAAETHAKKKAKHVSSEVPDGEEDFLGGKWKDLVASRTACSAAKLRAKEKADSAKADFEEMKRLAEEAKQKWDEHLETLRQADLAEQKVQGKMDKVRAVLEMDDDAEGIEGCSKEGKETDTPKRNLREANKKRKSAHELLAPTRVAKAKSPEKDQPAKHSATKSTENKGRPRKQANKSPEPTKDPAAKSTVKKKRPTKRIQNKKKEGEVIIYAETKGKRHYGYYNNQFKMVRLAQDDKILTITAFCRSMGLEGCWGRFLKVAGEDEEEDEWLADYVDSIITCEVCGTGDDANVMLMCDNSFCEAPYHIYCLQPRLSKVPAGEWKCPDCA